MTDKAKKFRCKRCREMWVTENYSVLRERTMDIWDKEIPRVKIMGVLESRVKEIEKELYGEKSGTGCEDCGNGEACGGCEDSGSCEAGICPKTGHWLINSDGYYPYCSRCNNEPQNRVMTKYCPNCGAFMEG